MKPQKQLFQISVNLWKWIDSGLYQRIRQHYNNSSQSRYSARVKAQFEFYKPLFLGGLHKENDAMCDRFISGLVSVEKFLECTHEEADD